jgi:predicted ArsR family transcriptional regulator
VSGDLERQIAGAAALHDPVRRSLYLFVAASTEPVSREQAATAVGVQKALAAFHLDKLADEGLLDFEFRRLTGRSGPGAGRPAKLYRRSQRQIDLTLPRREYDLAASLLAAAIEAAAASGHSVRDELEHSSSEFGRRMGEHALATAGPRPTRRAKREALVEVLVQHGFEPTVVGDDIALANCPFHTVAQQFTDLVCGMNLHLLSGLRSVLQLEDQDLEPRLAPSPGQCCVRFSGAR